MLQLKDISTPEQLLALYEEMLKVASIKMEGDDPDVYAERLNELASWVATSGKALADAKYHYNKALKNSILNTLKDSKRVNLPASTLNELVKADSHDLKYLSDAIEQVDKNFKYQIESLRSLISLKKQEIATSIYQR